MISDSYAQKICEICPLYMTHKKVNEISSKYARICGNMHAQNINNIEPSS